MQTGLRGGFRVQTDLPDLVGGFAVIAIPAHKVWESLKVSPGPFFYTKRQEFLVNLLSFVYTRNEGTISFLYRKQIVVCFLVQRA